MLPLNLAHRRTRLAKVVGGEGARISRTKHEKRKYMKLTKIAAALIGAATLATISASALAVPITILVGPPAPTPTDNVLFNNPSLPSSGLLVQGVFNSNSAGAGNLVNFSSTSGSKLLLGNGG